MNCTHCGEHILATTNISWNRGDYHPDCIGEAVLQYRANQERIDKGLPPDMEPFMDEEPFQDEYTPFEENDDLEDIEEVIARLDNQPEVSDEILNQIPAEQGNGRAIIPANPIPIGGITIESGNGSRNVGTLIAGRDTRFVPRPFLATIPTPESTDTFKPIGHADLINQIMDSLWYRRMNVVRDEYAVSTDGMKMFGLIELDIEYKGVRFAIGIRNANDRSMRVAMVAGYKVTVCSNMMLQGDFNPMLSKHSKKFELQDALSIACDRIQRNFGNLHQEITAKQERVIEPSFARELCYKAFTDGRFPISLLRTVHKEYFEQPSYEEFAKPTLFSLENAFTTAFKKLEPLAQFQATARLGKFLAAV
jgi:hypothetical protein